MENTREILAKSQQGLSRGLNEKIIKKCSCGATFDAWRVQRHDGTIYPGNEKCQKCQAIDDNARRKVEAEKQLTDTVQTVTCYWEDDSNVPPLFRLKTFENYETKLQPKAVSAIKKLQWKFDEETMKTASLVLLSPGVYGVGKTHLVCALVNKSIETEKKAYLNDYMNVQTIRCPVYFTTENELLRRIRATYDHKDGGETEEDIYKKLSRFDLLIVDDVGKVRPRDLTFLQGVYFNIIDQRYTDADAIILTTNLDYSELESHIGGACADRLREMCGKDGFVKMSGSSYRQRAK